MNVDRNVGWNVDKDRWKLLQMLDDEKLYLWNKRRTDDYIKRACEFTEKKTCMMDGIKRPSRTGKPSRSGSY